MNRNRYVYCLADAAVVVSSSREKGGTWTGAVENLKEGWVPLWIKSQPASTAGSGNGELVQRGGQRLPESVNVSELLQTIEAVANGPSNGGGSLFDHAPHKGESARKGDEQLVKQSAATSFKQRPVEPLASQPTAPDLSFYNLFLQRMEALTANNALTVEQLLDRFDITKSQLTTWLKRGVEEKRLRKLNKPARYGWIGRAAIQASMFER